MATHDLQLWLRLGYTPESALTAVASRDWAWLRTAWDMREDVDGDD